MFINAMPKSYCFSIQRDRQGQVGSAKILIPSWIRAPLSLSSRQHAYFFWSVARSSFENEYSRKRKSFEFIFTPYHPRDWGNMWRLEVQYYDKPGLMARLFRILSDLGIEVIAEESRNAFIPEFHVKSLMLDCSRYKFDIDAQYERLAGYEAQSRSQMWGLRNIILSEFIEYIRIIDGRPRLLLERNFAYENLVKVRNIEDSDVMKARLLLEKLPKGQREALPESVRNEDVFVSIPRGLPVLQLQRESLHSWYSEEERDEDAEEHADMGAADTAFDDDVEHEGEVAAASKDELDKLTEKSYLNFAVNAVGKIGYCRIVKEQAFSSHYHFIFYVESRSSIPKIIETFHASKLNILRSQISIGTLGLGYVKEVEAKGARSIVIPEMDEDDENNKSADSIIKKIGRWRREVYTFNAFAETLTATELESICGALQTKLNSARESDANFETIGFGFSGEAIAAANPDETHPGGVAEDLDDEAVSWDGAEIPDAGGARAASAAGVPKPGKRFGGKNSDMLGRLASAFGRLQAIEQLSPEALKVASPFQRYAHSDLIARKRLLWTIRKTLITISHQTPVPMRDGKLRLFLSFGFGKVWSHIILSMAAKVGKELGIEVICGAADSSFGTKDLVILDTVKNAILDADVFLVVMTPQDLVGGSWLAAELGIAIGAHKPHAVIAHQDLSKEKTFAPVQHKYCFLGTPERPFESHLEELMRDAFAILANSLIDDYFQS